MLKINISEKKSNVEVGQVRYNKSGMYVLIVCGEKSTYTAIVLKNKDANGVADFDWNSRDQSAQSIEQIYPYIADAELTIKN